MLKILQTWFHISDRINKDTEGRHVKQVSDIATDESEFFMKLPRSFVELRVSSRNSTDEFAFLDRNGQFYANFGHLDKFPNIDNNKDIHHLKIQVEYILTKPKFERYKLRTGYGTSYKFEGPIQPEFSISVPRGLKINENKSSYLDAVLTQKSEIVIGSIEDDIFEVSNLIHDPYEFKERELYNSIELEEDELEEDYYYRIIESFKNSYSESNYHINFGLQTNEELLDISKPYIKHDSNGEIYNFIIRRESYDKIVKSPLKCPITIEIGYTVRNKMRLTFFPIVGAFLLLGLLSYFLFTPIGKFTVNVPLTFLIGAISYSTLFSTLSFLHSYEIPYYRIVIGEIITIFILIGLIFTISIFFVDIANLKEQTIYSILDKII